MPLVKRCCICGRLCGEKPHNAFPYRNGVACDECNVKFIEPAKERKREKYAYQTKIS